MAPNPEGTQATTPEERLLLEEMARIAYGRIEGLLVRNGRPEFDARASVTRVVKLDIDERRGAATPLSKDKRDARTYRFLAEIRDIADGRVIIHVVEGTPTAIHITRTL